MHGKLGIKFEILIHYFFAFFNLKLFYFFLKIFILMIFICLGLTLNEFYLIYRIGFHWTPKILLSKNLGLFRENKIYLSHYAIRYFGLCFFFNLLKKLKYKFCFTNQFYRTNVNMLFGFCVIWSCCHDLKMHENIPWWRY